MLSLSAVTVSYGGLCAVRDLSLEASDGQITALIGRNGAGKTSTLSAIAGLVRPRGGAIVLNGKPITGLAPEQIAKIGISLVPENRRIFARLTVRENLLLAGAARSSRSGVKQDVDELAGRFPVLARNYDRSAALLSGGEQQQLAIARALVGQPQVLLLDEPSLGLAPKLVTEVFELISRLRDEGKTVLLVEQAASRAIELADRTYLLAKGAISQEGDRAAFSRDDAFATVYLGL